MEKVGRQRGRSRRKKNERRKGTKAKYVTKSM